MNHPDLECDRRGVAALDGEGRAGRRLERGGCRTRGGLAPAAAAATGLLAVHAVRGVALLTTTIQSKQSQFNTRRRHSG